MRITLLAQTLAACICLAANADDIESVVADCEGCHGPGGVSTDPDVPIIGGQSRTTLERALEAFRDWSRPCRRSAYRHGDTGRTPRNMCEVSESLSDDRIAELSAHFSGQQWIPAEQPFDEEKALVGASLYSLYCVTCHPGGGVDAGYAGRLAGQWTPYLQAMTRQISSGEWRVPKIMQRKMSSFTDREIDALLNYFAGQQD